MGLPLKEGGNKLVINPLTFNIVKAVVAISIRKVSVTTLKMKMIMG